MRSIKLLIIGIFWIFIKTSLSFEVVSEKENKALIWAYLQNASLHFDYFENVSHDVSDIPGHLVAASSSNQMIDKIGWITQSIISNQDVPDHLQAYWAGFLETNQTMEATEAFYNNSIKWVCDPPNNCEKLFTWLKSNMNFMLKQIKKSENSEFWHQVELILWQTKGMIDAYDKIFITDSKQLNQAYLEQLQDQVSGLYLMIIQTDLSDILQAVEGSADSRVQRLRNSRPSCSALIKVLPNNSDIYTAHDTWGEYELMLRVAKFYNLPWTRTKSTSQKVSGTKMSFSSYPSTWYSIDDYYIIGSGLTSIETTNNVFNVSLYNIVKKNSEGCVLECFRVMVANRLSDDIQEWVKNFRILNSGTYNNQWMILDRKKFVLGHKLPEMGLFMVAEQMPGKIVSQDMSKKLADDGFWSSFNLAYFKEIQDYSGQTNEEKIFGSFFSHDNCSRSQIFKRDQGRIVDLIGMYQIMRYNEFVLDPLSICPCYPPYSAQLAIAARGDLNYPVGNYPLKMLGYRLHGATDTKLSNHTMSNELSFLGVSSPTYEDLPPFQWSRLPIPHKIPSMLPDRWMFSPIIFKPEITKNTFKMYSAAHLSRKRVELEAFLKK